ncbi:tRNA uridine 5-carboxymethylaminomethyl modification enzyme MnmG [Bacteroidota bacterium]|nr:tRNA uridine 5-carboxymethylaminomethyl modification enzyme MnmG [Bacteroidota bacterium]
MFPEYDIIVVGAGHAGCEAAAAAANLGSKVMLVTMNMQTIAQMSCNPAMGGVAKGQIVREIDALGGYSGIVTDKTMIQFRMLNRSKGPAMWSPRAQSDRLLFAKEWRDMLEQTPNIDFWQDMVSGLLIKDGTVVGIRTGMGMEIRSKAVVLTNGTFLNGIIHIGEKQFGGGRMAEKSSTGITEQLISLGLESGRMKTGTPPRIDGRSLNYSLMEEQKGDENPGKFSYTNTTSLTKQKSCYITYTNQEVHDVLKTGFEQSPMFAGRIQGLGPRYCPSIEDKINRFADKTRHQLFIEPEGWDTIEIYVNGFSTSLPEEVQYKALKLIPGLENVRMFRPGYAIEYDFFPPHQLHTTLETRVVKNLFHAGQINGTTGYEEAACQGIMAGINAHQKINDQHEFILTRDEAYIGVLIDDLITKGTNEPYRMFTSRAEYRILLRQDNADIRLTPLAHKIGLVNDDRLELVNKKIEEAKQIMDFFRKESVTPDEINSILTEQDSSEIKQKTKLLQLLSRPQIEMKDLREKVASVKEVLAGKMEDSIEQAEILMKYEGYIEKEKEIVDKMNRLEYVPVPEDFDFSIINSLSLEAREKLKKFKPRTLGQASRISGVNPSDVSVLMVYLGR